MNGLWLLLIIPVVFTLGYLFRIYQKFIDPFYPQGRKEDEK